MIIARRFCCPCKTIHDLTVTVFCMFVCIVSCFSARAAERAERLSRSAVPLDLTGFHRGWARSAWGAVGGPLANRLYHFPFSNAIKIAIDALMAARQTNTQLFANCKFLDIQLGAEEHWKNANHTITNHYARKATRNCCKS